MSRLMERDLKDVLLVTRAALECNEMDEARKESLRQLEHIFRCDKSTFFLADAHGIGLEYDGVVTRGFDFEFMNLYEAYFHALDPYVIGLPDMPCVVTTPRLIPFEELIRTEYYNDFLAPQSIYYQMAIILKKYGKLLGALAFLRPRIADDFSPTDISKAELLAPYLYEIFRKLRDLESREARSDGRDGDGKRIRNAPVCERLAERGLGRRECDVALLVSQGFTNTEVSERLCISRYTVENHLKSIFAKWGYAIEPV
ncbi:MAG: hypothetical protein HY788_22200 [Deltaproteobacteria bacterium]|nr:hypothetical protein [Deltaproteobacteria bacterium]